MTNKSLLSWFGSLVAFCIWTYIWTYPLTNNIFFLEMQLSYINYITSIMVASILAYGIIREGMKFH